MNICKDDQILKRSHVAATHAYLVKKTSLPKLDFFKLIPLSTIFLRGR